MRASISNTEILLGASFFSGLPFLAFQARKHGVWFFYDHSFLTALQVVYIPSKISSPERLCTTWGMLVQKWNSSFGGYTLLISYANVRVSAMATTDLEGKYHELPGAHTRYQSDLGSYSSSANYQLCHHGQAIQIL